MTCPEGEEKEKQEDKYMKIKTTDNDNNSLSEGVSVEAFSKNLEAVCGNIFGAQ